MGGPCIERGEDIVCSPRIYKGGVLATRLRPGGSG
nr:MAG TPA: hypothetical protein [Bacteriophage sp.]